MSIILCSFCDYDSARAIPTSGSSITTHFFSLWYQWIQPRRQGLDRCLQTSWFISSTRQLVLWLSSRRWSSNLFGVKVEVLTLVHDIWLENLGSTWSGAPCVKQSDWNVCGVYCLGQREWLASPQSQKCWQYGLPLRRRLRRLLRICCGLSNGAH